MAEGSRIAVNVSNVLRRMAEAARRSGRAPDAASLVAVTKGRSIEEIKALLALGVKDVAENRVKEAREKADIIGPERWHGVRRHMIGTLQRRKCRDIVSLFDCVDSVDRVEMAEVLQIRCQEQGKRLPILLEVNVSGEASKHGFCPEDLEAAVERIAGMDQLGIAGLMTMAPLTADPETVRPVFAKLRRLSERLSLKELSMGMSNDFDVAIEEGATQVRIGSALFV